MLARQVTADEFRRIIVAGATILDLVDRRNRGSQLCHEVYLMRGAMAVAASRLIAVHAALDGSRRFAVTLVAAHLVRQGLEILALVLSRYVGVAIGTRMVWMRCRREHNCFMAFATVRIRCKCQ